LPLPDAAATSLAFGGIVHDMQELLKRRNPSLHTGVQTNPLLKVFPGFTHANEFGNSVDGHGLHCGEDLGPHVVMSEYCVLEQVSS
jgi:hypothetical protein